MKRLSLSIFAFAAALFGCQQQESLEPVGEQMKTVTLTADMTAGTKASIDSQTGEFQWQAGDVISVLATDNKFYDFTLVEGEADRTADFAGRIPETAEVTTVATYPAVAANGTENTFLSGTTFNFTLPAEYTWKKDVSNVPMVATFAEGAKHMSFKQIGGVIRFPVKNMPAQATFVLTTTESTITGAYPVDLTKVGETEMVSVEGASVLTINYSSETEGDNVEFSVPVPTGVYKNYTVQIKDQEGEVRFEKVYEAENKVERRYLVNMAEIEVPAPVVPEPEPEPDPLPTPTVWPYFVDARVIVPAGEAQYAAYVDGAEEAVICDVVMVNENPTIVIGGDFDHNTTHTVAIAKVAEGAVQYWTKSEAVEFTTGDVMQITYNTGTRFICAGWDDVAIGMENSIRYDKVNKKWEVKPRDLSVSDRNMRGYRIQLYAEDKTTLLYDEVPFSSQVDFGGGISNSSWIGVLGGQNVLLPTSMSFGWLEPGKTYYFRVQTLAEPVIFTNDANNEFRCYNDASYQVYSTRGGCAWSELVPMTTDAPHVASDNEVFYEGFDDMMFNGDIMNISVAAVPEFVTNADEAGKYKNAASGPLYRAWADKMAQAIDPTTFAITDPEKFKSMKFSEQGFNTMLGAIYHGLTNETTNAANVKYDLNSYAGSLAGWSISVGTKNKPARSMNAGFGSVRLGESGTGDAKVSFWMPALQSSKLSDTEATPCVLKLKVSAHATKAAAIIERVGAYQYRGDSVVDSSTSKTTVFGNTDEWAENNYYNSDTDYLHYPRWYEVEYHFNLMNGDVIEFTRPNPSGLGLGGCITIGEVSIEIE